MVAKFRNKISIKTVLWVEPLPHNWIYTWKETEPPILLLWEKLTEMLYVPRIGKRYSVSYGKADTSGATYFYHFEGSFPAGRELMEPFSV
jgi:hypothetical protein